MSRAKAPPPTTLSEMLERLNADMAEAKAQLRFRQGQVDDLKNARAALLAAIQRYTEETEDA